MRYICMLLFLVSSNFCYAQEIKIPQTDSFTYSYHPNGVKAVSFSNVSNRILKAWDLNNVETYHNGNGFVLSYNNSMDLISKSTYKNFFKLVQLEYYADKSIKRKRNFFKEHRTIQSIDFFVTGDTSCITLYDTSMDNELLWSKSYYPNGQLHEFKFRDPKEKTVEMFKSHFEDYCIAEDLNIHPYNANYILKSIVFNAEGDTVGYKYDDLLGNYIYDANTGNLNPPIFEGELIYVLKFKFDTSEIGKSALKSLMSNGTYFDTMKITVKGDNYSCEKNNGEKFIFRKADCGVYEFQNESTSMHFTSIRSFANRSINFNMDTTYTRLTKNLTKVTNTSSITQVSNWYSDSLPRMFTFMNFHPMEEAECDSMDSPDIKIPLKIKLFLQTGIAEVVYDLISIREKFIDSESLKIPEYYENRKQKKYNDGRMHKEFTLKKKYTF